jgi:general secretion pathway protein A
MDYLSFFGLQQEPFSNAPVSRFYYDSLQHGQALLRLKHAVMHMKGLAILIGGIGAGKTTLARRLLDSLDEREYEAALLVIIHSGVTADWLLRRIAIQLGVEQPASDKLTLLGQLYRRLIEIHESGKKAVVLIDEAQMLASQELMEEFRGLLNLEIPERKLISFVFFGLPDIELNLQFDPPLAQRVALRVHLQPLDEKTTRAYVEHRMRTAGAERSPFEPATFPLIHRATNGLPRLVNTLCDNALFEAALARSPTIGAALVRQVASNLALPLDDALERPLPIPGLPDNTSNLPTQLPVPPGFAAQGFGSQGHAAPPVGATQIPILPPIPAASVSMPGFGGPPASGGAAGYGAAPGLAVPVGYGSPPGYAPPAGYPPSGGTAPTMTLGGQSTGYGALPPGFGLAAPSVNTAPFTPAFGAGGPSQTPPAPSGPLHLGGPQAAMGPQARMGPQAGPAPSGARAGGGPPGLAGGPGPPSPPPSATTGAGVPVFPGFAQSAPVSNHPPVYAGVPASTLGGGGRPSPEPARPSLRAPPPLPSAREIAGREAAPPAREALPVASAQAPAPPPPPPSNTSDTTTMRGALEEIDRVLTSLGKR